MLEKILQWCGTIFAIVGVVFLFLEAIGSIRKRSNTKLSILGLVFLSISLVGYLITEIILRSKGLPSVFSFVWIIFLWAYLVCNIVSAVKISKKNRTGKKKRKKSAVTDEPSSDSDTVSENADEPAADEKPSQSGDAVLEDTPTSDHDAQ